MQNQQQELIELPQTSQVHSELILNKIIEAGKSITSDFKIEEIQNDYYVNLYLYFANNYSCKWDLSKGLMICGNVGTGKTMSMTIMQKLFRNFAIVNTRYIIRDFLTEKLPMKVIDQYGRDSFKIAPGGNIDKTKPLIKCFDDFGLENINAKNYGNSQNVMEEIILDRYDMFVSYGMKTYATTNLNPEMIEECYGQRVKDRLKQMCNYVTLTGTSKRK